MNTELKKRLHDAAEACRAIQSFTAGVTFTEYAANLLLRSGVERQFEIMGEALNQAATMDAELAKSLPELRRIVGMGNRIIHGYDSVDDAIVWDAIQHHVPPLLAGLSQILM